MLKELLSKIQVELNVPKAQYNAFAKFNYRSCEDILDKVKPLLDARDITLILGDEVVEIGSRYYVKAYATLYYKEELLTVCAYAREEDEKKGMDGSQITGAASSYARKYALNGMFLIDDSRDADTQDNSQHVPNAPAPIAKSLNTTVEEVADVMEGVLQSMTIESKTSKAGKQYKIARYAFTQDEGKTFENISSFDMKHAVPGDAMRFVGVVKAYGRLSAKMVEVKPNVQDEIPFGE